MKGLTNREKAQVVAEASLERAAEEVVALDVGNAVSYADVFVICTGHSDRQVRSIADAIEEAVVKHGERPLGIEGYDEGLWVLMDFADVIVHVFQQEVRRRYDLERLWSDVPRLDLCIEEDDPSNGRTLAR
ncbi:MAG: ribosome silencing factor [Deltaproteobacteria bacterium]|nr:ribosome silencing factor [Deltaproteobacteria bacterium]